MADLITIDEYKTFASIEGKKTDPQIAALITSCSEIVEEFLGYKLANNNETISTFKAIEDCQVYMLPNFNMSVTKVQYIPRRGAAIDLDIEDFEISDTGRLEVYDLMPNRGDTFKVTYTATHEVMESIKLATMLLVKYYYKEEFNKTSVAAGGQTVSYQTGKNFPPQVRAILMMYRIL